MTASLTSAVGARGRWQRALVSRSVCRGLSSLIPREPGGNLSRGRPCPPLSSTTTVSTHLSAAPLPATTSRSLSSMFSQYLPLLFLPSLAAAYSFSVDTTPRQCDTLNVSIIGSGQPPYSLLVVPFGPSPLPNNTEVRTIVQQNFSGTSTALQLKYPQDSQFVIVVRSLLVFPFSQPPSFCPAHFVRPTRVVEAAHRRMNSKAVPFC